MLSASTCVKKQAWTLSTLVGVCLFRWILKGYTRAYSFSWFILICLISRGGQPVGSLYMMQKVNWMFERREGKGKCSKKKMISGERSARDSMNPFLLLSLHCSLAGCPAVLWKCVAPFPLLTDLCPGRHWGWPHALGLPSLGAAGTSGTPTPALSLSLSWSAFLPNAY